MSLQTVSRVINNEPNVRPAMSERVRDAVAKLGYVPSIAAQRMGGSRSYLIMALNDRDRTIDDWRSREGADWVGQMLLGGMLACAEGGYRLILELVDTHLDHVEREVLGALQSLRPDGVILTPPHSDNPKITALLQDQGVPFARIGSIDTRCGVAIAMDDRAAAIRATEHLLAFGHRRVGFIAGTPDYALSAARLEGYCEAMRAAGLTPRHQPGDFGYDSGLAAARTLLSGQDRVTAIVASSDRMALACVAAATERGWRIPDDLSVVSFDDTPLARFSHPPLTAIAQPIAAMSARAAAVLMGKPQSAEAVEWVPFDLIERASTGPAPDDARA